MGATAVSAQNIVKRYKIKDLHGIRAGWVYDIHIEEGNSDYVYIKGPKEYMDDVVVMNDNGVLSLDDKKTMHNFNFLKRENRNQYDKVITVQVKMSRLDVIILSGAARLTTNGSFKGGKVTCKLSGAAAMNKTSVAVETLCADISGASRINLTGSFKVVKASVSGASQCALDGQLVELSVSQTGASKMLVNAMSTSMKYELSGASKLTLNGNTQNLDIEGSGACNVSGGNMTARNLKVDLSGACSVTAKVLNSVNGEISGASRLSYSGDVSISKVSTSGSAEVKVLKN